MSALLSSGSEWSKQEPHVAFLLFPVSGARFFSHEDVVFTMSRMRQEAES